MSGQDDKERESLPLGWVETEFGQLNFFKSASIKPSEYPEEIFELYSVPNFPKGVPEIQSGSDIGSNKQLIEPNDVLVCKINPRINRVWKVHKVTDKRQIGSSEWIVFRSQYVVANYFQYFCQSTQFRNRLCKDVTGVGGSLTRAQPKKVATFPIPLPPLAEQQRIADKLDTLLTRVEAARQRLERVPKLLKQFRQSVLSAAVSGELTREWRGGGEKEWEEVEFAKVCTNITVGFVGKMADKYIDSGIPFLRSQNVRPFKFDTKNLLYISEEFHTEIKKSALTPGDVVVVRSGAPGQCCVIPKDLPVANCSDLVIIRPSDKLNPSYACIFINSETSQAFVRSEGVGVAQIHFNVGSMKRTPLSLPNREEQQEIVHRVETLFAMADRVEAKYAAAISTYERLTPSLLAKAFRGELVPQDPNDEPASVLLERIREQRAAETAKGKKAKGTRKPKAKSSTATAKRGRPPKTAEIDTATDEAEAIKRLQERKQEKAAKLVGLFEE